MRWRAAAPAMLTAANFAWRPTELHGRMPLAGIVDCAAREHKGRLYLLMQRAYGCFERTLKVRCRPSSAQRDS
jgi:hypothetical protein